MTNRNMVSSAIRGVSRRMFMRVAAGAGSFAAVALRTSRTIAEQPEAYSSVVTTEHGGVRGHVRGGVEEFKGINYGAATGGANRFLPPKRPKTWKRAREALTCGSPCPQHNPWQANLVDFQPVNEDCLVLNVWSPTYRDRKDVPPVVVWIHRAGFESEAGGSPAYAGDQLAKTGNVVVVSLNHRLNIFGYYCLANCADERSAASGNIGHLDLIAALKWVRDNIANFGGDPTNVTIFGESGCGAKVTPAIAMPNLKGPFHEAIVQSGRSLSKTLSV